VPERERRVAEHLPAEPPLTGRINRMVTTVTAYILLILFFALEGVLRKGRAAKSLVMSASDRGSTLWVGRAFLIAAAVLLLAPLLNYWELGLIRGGSHLAWLGIFLMLGGIALRVWSNRVLGEFYTRTLRTVAQQRLIREGPYRVLRHPGYLGFLLMWAGAGLATSNWLAIVLSMSVMVAAYGFRISAEESMLLGTFGEEYEQYRRRTWKLIPFLF
jgi:protein-S-isoprenylcysteine O-methyltransferase